MSKKKSRVSIVIPIFNGEKYLGECIESALNQNYSNIEVIAIDDGSTDNSVKILEKYAEKIKIIKKPNGGTASALNAGIKQMSGEWFKWLSQDDVLFSYSIEELIKFADKLEDKKRSIIVSNYHIIDSDGEIIEDFKQSIPYHKTSFDFNVALLHHYIGNANSSLIHKSAFQEFGLFNESRDILPDYELWLRYCLIYSVKIVLVPKFLLKYRSHKESFSESTSKEEWEHLNQHVKKFILKKLNFKERQKYEKALKNYERKFKMKRKIISFLNIFLPKDMVIKIQEVYKRR